MDVRPQLKSLSVSGFRSFVDDATIEFPESGLVLLQGRNLDTGGSSGSGKSSVNLAIAFALGYCPFPSTNLVSWGGKSTMKVEVRLLTDAGEVRVKRSSSPVQMWIDGVQVKGGAKVVEERLRSILGVTPDVLGLLTYRGQRQPGLFLSKTDAEKKELLTQLLGLDRFEAAIETSQAKLKELEAKLGVAQARWDAASGAASALPEHAPPEAVQVLLDKAKEDLEDKEAILRRGQAAVESLTKQRDAAAQAALDSFNERIAAVRAGLAAIAKPAVSFDDTEGQRLRGLIAGAEQRIGSLEQADTRRQRETREKRDQLQKKVLACRQVHGQRLQIMRDQERLEGELAALEANTCPTCERAWEQAADRKAELQEQLRVLEGALHQCDLAETAEASLRAEMDGLPEFQPNPMIGKLKEARAQAQGQLAAENERKRAAEATADAQHRQARAEVQARLSDLQAQQQKAYAEASANTPPELVKASQIVRTLEVAVSNLRLDVAVFNQKITEAKQHAGYRLQLQQQAAEALLARDFLVTQLNEEKDLLGALGREGFLGSIFDEVLAEISDETNRILASIANTRHCTLTFRSEAVTQKGTVKKTIVPVVDIGGHEATLDAGPSGGMLSVIELAVDLAVGAVLSRREGVCPGWLILDESFNGLDPVSMESCMEILNLYAQDRLVLVVDHASEFKSLFSRFITIEFTDGRSRIVA